MLVQCSPSRRSLTHLGSTRSRYHPHVSACAEINRVLGTISPAFPLSQPHPPPTPRDFGFFLVLRVMTEQIPQGAVCAYVSAKQAAHFMAAEVIATATRDLSEKQNALYKVVLQVEQNKGGLKELRSTGKPGDTAENQGMVHLKAPAAALLRVQHRNDLILLNSFFYLSF